jgi:hypothetical protein
VVLAMDTYACCNVVQKFIDKRETLGG